MRTECIQILANTGLVIPANRAFTFYTLDTTDANGFDASGAISDDYMRFRTQSGVVNAAAQRFYRIYQINGPLNSPDYPNPVPFISTERVLMLDEMKAIPDVRIRCMHVTNKLVYDSNCLYFTP